MSFSHIFSHLGFENTLELFLNIKTIDPTIPYEFDIIIEIK